MARGIIAGSDTIFDVKIDVVLRNLDVLRELRQTYSTELRFGESFRQHLQRMKSERQQLVAVAQQSIPENWDEIAEELLASGFSRTLREFQLKNLCKLMALSHGADFSVPGAGKTTVALAGYALRKTRGDVERLLVVAPLAAFSAWKEDTADCFLDAPPEIAVHLGPGTVIPTIPNVLLTNYHRLANDYERIRRWVASKPTQVILDEAHRVKRGRSGVHGAAALDLAFVAKRRDILTGTPAPQGAYDLVALISFLYPGHARQILPSEAFVEHLARDRVVLEATHGQIKKFFVRSCKNALGLPKTNTNVIRRPMGPVQAVIYKALVGQYKGALSLETPARRSLRNLGKIVIYLLEASTNPLLLTAGSTSDDLPHFAHPPLEVQENDRIMDLLKRYAEFERPWKYDVVKEIVQEAAERGEKVLIWCSFIRNMQYLKRELSEFNPAEVHGGIFPEDGAPAGATTTREDELDRFRHDPDCSVLIANPAACGEGVSLHHWCHHAVYLERTFNAGHFLQSQDRIHRLGLAEGTETQFTLLLSQGSIDTKVDDRIREKVIALSVLMDDPGLVKVALPDEDNYTEDGEADGDVIAENDYDAIVAHINEE